MNPIITTAGLNRRYGDLDALADVDLAIEKDTITGLLGRNGAGKSTLMRILSGREFPSGGTVSVFGREPAEDADVMRRMVFVSEDQRYPDLRVSQVLAAARMFRPAWDEDFAATLVGDFALPRRRKVKKLSRGQRSALGIVIALASRAEVTLFDEPYLGLDAVARTLFYDHLLADYAAHPRTFIVSTHLIDEIAPLLEDVVVIDRGHLTLSVKTDELAGRAAAVRGAAERIDEFARGHRILRRSDLGALSVATIEGPFDEHSRRLAQSLDLDLEPVSLQDLIVAEAAPRDSATQGGVQ